jgi:outer membrane receptor for ferrienterochelin and colicin
MKKGLVLSFLAFGLIVLTSCGSTNETTAPASDRDVSKQSNLSLADILRKNTSLTVMGTGNNVKVIVRGFSTIQLNTQPLYVLDGYPIGNNYAQANNLINPMEVAEVRVLRNTSELTIYGEDGTNGVILITTKSAKKQKTGN